MAAVTDRANQAADRPRCVDCGADLTHQTRCYVFEGGHLVRGAYRCLRCDRERPDATPADRAAGGGQ